MPRFFQPSSRTPIHWSWITLAGPDARDFLHRLTTTNTQAMSTGEGQKGCFLTAQGRIRAYFHLWNYQKDEYGFEFDAGPDDQWKKELLAVIDQYTFAEKMTLTDVTGMESIWVFDWAEAPVEPGKTGAVDDGIRVCHHGDSDFGRAWVTLWGTPQKLSSWVAGNLSDSKTLDLSQLESWRVEALKPWVNHEITQNTVPLEAGLKDAISPNKGCYPGQEVIEKIISLGSPARRLAKISGSGPLPAQGTKLLNLANPPVEVGEITSSTAAGGEFAALGFVKKIHAKEGNEVKVGQLGRLARIRELAPYA